MTSDRFTEPYSNASLESMFAYIRINEDGRHSFQRMLSLSTSMFNQTNQKWLRNHPDWPNIIKEVLKGRESTKVRLLKSKHYNFILK